MRTVALLIFAFSLASCSRPLEQPEAVGSPVIEEGPISVADGPVVRLEGGEIEFVGACDLAGEELTPWDIEGWPLDQEKANLFWKVLDRDPTDAENRKAWAQEIDRRSFALVFLYRGDLDVSTILGDENRLYDLLMISSKQPDPEEGIASRSIALQLKPLPKDGKFIFRLEAKNNEPMQLAKFIEGEPPRNDGFQFEILEKQLQRMTRATEKRQDELPFTNYVVLVRTPEHVPKMELELELESEEGATRKEDVGSFMLELSFGVPGDTIDQRLSGATVFNIRVPEERASPAFVLTARARQIIEFRGIPLARR